MALWHTQWGFVAVSDDTAPRALFYPLDGGASQPLGIADEGVASAGPCADPDAAGDVRLFTAQREVAPEIEPVPRGFAPPRVELRDCARGRCVSQGSRVRRGG